MRLICPRCGAQYEIDDAAIPPTGRDVECSACDHVWRAARPQPPQDTMPFDAAARPALNRPLSDSVIEILRAEASRELEARAAERHTRRAAAKPLQDSGAAADAATGTGDRAGAASARTPSAGWFDEPAGLTPLGKGTDHIDAGDMTGGAAPAQATSDGVAVDDGQASGGDDQGVDAERQAGDNPAGVFAPIATSHPAPPPTIAAAETPVPRQHPDLPPTSAAPSAAAIRARRRHDAGYHLAVMVALIALALYALAPRIADQGVAGQRLMMWRAQVDEGRDWLAAQADAVLGRVRRGGD